MKKVRILIADDVPADAKVLIEKLDNYFQSKKISASDFEIVVENTIGTAQRTIEENEPFDIFFADINFGETSIEKRNGYYLVRKAFEKSPITYICVYSGIADEEPSKQREYVNLLKRGVLADIYKKDFFRGSDNTIFKNRFKKSWNFVQSQKFVWDLWNNHKAISDTLTEDSEIRTNLDSIIFLLKNLFLLKNDEQGSYVILYRLCIQLYHRCLEIFISKDKDENKIVEDSNDKRKTAEAFLIKENLFEKKDKDGKDRHLILGEGSSALRKLIAYSIDDKFKYGYLLNKYRNNSVHRYNFLPELANVIFANLTLALYVLGEKKNISTLQIESLLEEKKFQEENEYGLKDLRSLIDYIDN